MDKFKFDEKFIQNALNNFFALNTVKYFIENLFVFDWESDKLIETKSGYIYEFEIKISKSDYKNDFKHKVDKHVILEGEEKYGDKFLPKYYELKEESKKRGGENGEQLFMKYVSESKRYYISEYKRPNYFYYAVPKDMLKVEDVPEYAGLVYVDETGKLQIIKQAPKLHKEKYSDSELNLSEKFYYNMQRWMQRSTKYLSESNSWREKFISEIKSKTNCVSYVEMERQLQDYKDKYVEALETATKTEKKLTSELILSNRIIRGLVKEIRKYEPEFNQKEFEEKFEQC